MCKSGLRILLCVLLWYILKTSTNNLTYIFLLLIFKTTLKNNGIQYTLYSKGSHKFDPHVDIFDELSYNIAQ